MELYNTDACCYTKLAFAFVAVELYLQLIDGRLRWADHTFSTVLNVTPSRSRFASQLVGWCVGPSVGWLGAVHKARDLWQLALFLTNLILTCFKTMPFNKCSFNTF